jgi:hypothetical protein
MANRSPNYLVYNTGLTVNELAARHNISRNTLTSRILRGVEPPELMEQPGSITVANHIAAQLRGDKKFEGKPCKVCKNTIRHTCNKNCVNSHTHYSYYNY